MVRNGLRNHMLHTSFFRITVKEGKMAAPPDLRRQEKIGTVYCRSTRTACILRIWILHVLPHRSVFEHKVSKQPSRTIYDIERAF